MFVLILVPDSRWALTGPPVPKNKRCSGEVKTPTPSFASLIVFCVFLLLFLNDVSCMTLNDQAILSF